MDYKYTGIILTKRDVGEADRIYTLYTKEAGKIKAKASGVRKSTSKLAGSLENFTLADIFVAKKRGTGRITGSIVENNFSHLRNNLETAIGVWNSVKLVERLTGFEIEDNEIFENLREYLETADEIARDTSEISGVNPIRNSSGAFDPAVIKPIYSPTVSKPGNIISNGVKEKIDLISLGFAFRLLNELGYKIEVNKCLECGKKITAGENYFSPALGGVICAQCAKGSREASRIQNNVIKLIRIFFQNKIRSLAKLKVPPEEIKNLKSVLQNFLRQSVE